MVKWRALLVGNDPGCGCERTRSVIDLEVAPSWPERVEHLGKRYQIVPHQQTRRSDPPVAEQGHCFGFEPVTTYTQKYLEIGGL